MCGCCVQYSLNYMKCIICHIIIYKTLQLSCDRVVGDLETREPVAQTNSLFEIPKSIFFFIGLRKFKSELIYYLRTIFIVQGYKSEINCVVIKCHIV